MSRERDILKGAMERFDESQTGSSEVRDAAHEDIEFARLGEQWPAEVRKARAAEGRPCLTVNKLPAFIRHVVNQARQAKPSIKVSPVDGGADVETAEVIAGLVRSIERHSDADVAYDTAIDHAVTCGFGFFRIGIEYAHDDTFDLEARIERIANPLMVHWDVTSTRFDASDWDYAFVSDWLSLEQFKARYPGAKATSFAGDNRDATQFWWKGDDVRVAEYWERTEGERELVLLSSGAAVRADRMGELARAFLEQAGLDLGGQVDDEEAIRAAAELGGVSEVRRRRVAFGEVRRRIITGAEVLEDDEWPGTTIPICPVWGDEVYFDGVRHFRSLVRDTRDPQAMVNFWRSASTELVALAPRAPFLMPQDAIPKNPAEAAKWATANTRSHAYLTYAGSQMPQRQPFAGVPAGAVQEALNASDDIKAITGIYDASLGARSNETSGRAIMARQAQGDVSNFHFIDNLSRAIRYCGRCLVEIIPAVYSTRQAIRILGEDEAEKVVRLRATGGGGALPGPEGEEGRLYDLAVGKYDVSVSTGPSYATQREEARAFLLEILQRVPGAAPLLGDVVLEHLDFAGAQRIADRLKLILPPQIQAAEGITPPGGQQPPPGQMPGSPAPGTAPAASGMPPAGSPLGGPPGAAL